MSRALFGLTGMLAIGYIALCTYLYLQQRAMLYLPVPTRGQLDTIQLPVVDVEIRASVANLGAERAIVYFGGNAEDVSQTAEELAAAYPERAIYALHYRGYGRSGGMPTETDLVADARTLLALVGDRHVRLSVVGRSLGSGVAVQAAIDREIERLTLVTPFADLVGVGQEAFWFLPVGLMMQDRFESTRYTAQLRAPVRVIIAERDEIIPRWSSDELVDSLSAQGQPEVVVIKGRGHNDVQLDPGYWTLLVATTQ